MPFVCSRCHTHFEAEADAEHMACPNCKAEAGLEPVKSGAPPAMRYFGGILALLGAFAVLGSIYALLA
ncbi:zinc ribbon domain-containing protein [Pseudenhygromyxa sp. WMMC2535]|uniref:zinc ribbon domain-containing protein n=1 Tax=Pseudenhygromyxa sp. WMMC2535 TaxID=2712867 RepID=UPI001553A3AD|nr:zinc ribbon domain-containing protein [Pseudenhygromyxa sp. WMMC2535]NVB40772.1 zinc ribbon domain-containing protein [Pseudenhygromyxa sp. WMMC2535]